MIAAAVATTAAAPPVTGGLPVNWFDLVVVVVMGFGVYRGRHNGMSKELLDLLQWLVMVTVCGLGYPMLAGRISEIVPPSLFFSLMSYVALALIVFLVFKILKRQFNEKLAMTNFFRGGEYYLGMLSGIIRYSCGLLCVLALLNAPYYSPKEIAKIKAEDEKNFGGVNSQGDFFPHVATIQAAVFKESFFGPLIKDHLAMLLIDTKGTVTETPEKTAPEPPKKKPMIKIG